MGELDPGTHHESVVPDLRHGVRFYYSDEPRPKYVPFHWHNSVELVYVLDGHLRFVIGGHPHHIRTGEFAMVQSGAVHDVASGPNHAYVLQVPLRAIRPFFSNPESVAFVNGRTWTPEYAEVISQVQTMGNIIKHPSAEGDFDFEICLLNILKRMFCSFRDPEPHSASDARIKEILAYLQDHVTEAISVGELASLFGYNPSYLSRMFKEQTGISLVSYVYTLRVNRLYEDLLETDLSVTELMAADGLTNPRLARQVFQRQFGMLPKDVRARKASDQKPDPDLPA